MYKAQSQALARDNLAKMTDAHGRDGGRDSGTAASYMGSQDTFCSPPKPLSHHFWYPRNANTIDPIFFHATKAGFIPVKASVPSYHHAIIKGRKAAMLRF